MDMNPYITFNGEARAALDHYAAALGGEVAAVMTFDEIPGDMPIPDGFGQRLAHGRVIYPGGTLMVSDQFADASITYGGFSIQTDWPTVARAQEVFEAMAEGGEITMPFAASFWAAGFGMLRDKFGVPWMMNCDVET